MPTTLPPQATDTRPLRIGADLAAMVPGLAPFGLALGATAVALHTGGAAAVLGAGLVYAGSAQLTATSMAAGGAGIAALVLAGVLVNSRLMLYGGVLEPQFARQSRLFRLLGAHFIIDATFAAATARTDLDTPQRFARYWRRLGVGVLVIWTSSVAAGVLLAPLLPAMPHLGLVGYALFAALLAPRLPDRPAVAAAGSAAVTALLLTSVFPAVAVPVAAGVGVFSGVLVKGRPR